jgi:hypothetical protein
MCFLPFEGEEEGEGTAIYVFMLNKHTGRAE